LLPKDEEDANLAEQKLMRNVNFRKTPHRLFAIITTPENIERVKEWAKSGGINPSKVHDFDSFIKLFDRDISQPQPISIAPTIKPSQGVR